MQSPRAIIVGTAVVAAAVWLSAMSWVAGDHIASRNGAEGSEGQRRQDVLRQITETYSEKSSPHAGLYAPGKIHPPIKYINVELKKRDAKWRVRLEHDRIDWFDVS